MTVFAVLLSGTLLSACQHSQAQFCATSQLMVPPPGEVAVLEGAPVTTGFLDTNNLLGVELGCSWARGYGR